jgi:G:T-mismatch repair DNA endonuclease (very short patch repair protein)|tara:strand:+ start:135 stop:1052 length:918 start_codon:yes stop_codon:yes gene_type:complete
MVGVCSIEGCKRPHQAKGYCDMHYRRKRRRPNEDPSTTESRESINKKISDALTDKPKSKEHRANQSKTVKAQYVAGERISPMKNKNHTQESKDKQSKKMTGRPSGFKGKTHSLESKEQARISALKREPETKENRDKRVAKIINTYNTDPSIAKSLSEHHKNSPKVMAAIAHARTVSAKPNKPEKAIHAILSSIGVEAKFLKNIEYRNSDGKIKKKNVDLIWKDPNGKKKIIEYNGRYHFDPRDFQPDEIVTHHNTEKPAHEVWDKEIPVLNQIRKQGYEILVVWQKDFKKDLENETKKIIDFVLT